MRLAVGTCLVLAAQGALAMKVGVLAPRGELEATTRWSEFGKYLSARIGEPVQVVPLSAQRVVAAAAGGEVDMVLSHPGHSLAVEEQLKARHVATLNERDGSQFAGVIIARKGSGIRRAEDLKGKQVLSLSKNAAGAYVFQAYHMMQKGVDVEKDVVRREGRQQDDLVLAVKAGLADAAFVRTGVLEAMAQDGKIRMGEFVIVDERKDPGLNYVHTTALYPEWYLSALPKLDAALEGKVKSAVLALTPNDGACKTAKIRGFVEPIPLDGMKQALQALKLPPYDK
jgi:ABC-type phosphate/phosphonate transport system substrate-binding protein